MKYDSFDPKTTAMFYERMMDFFNKSRGRSAERLAYGVPAFTGWKLRFVESVVEVGNGGNAHKANCILGPYESLCWAESARTARERASEIAIRMIRTDWDRGRPNDFARSNVGYAIEIIPFGGVRERSIDVVPDDGPESAEFRDGWRRAPGDRKRADVTGRRRVETWSANAGLDVVGRSSDRDGSNRTGPPSAGAVGGANGDDPLEVATTTSNARATKTIGNNRDNDRTAEPRKTVFPWLLENSSGRSGHCGKMSKAERRRLRKKNKTSAISNERFDNDNVERSAKSGAVCGRIRDAIVGNDRTVEQHCASSASVGENNERAMNAIKNGQSYDDIDGRCETSPSENANRQIGMLKVARRRRRKKKKITVNNINIGLSCENYSKVTKTSWFEYFRGIYLDTSLFMYKIFEKLTQRFFI